MNPRFKPQGERMVKAKGKTRTGKNRYVKVIRFSSLEAKRRA